MCVFFTTIELFLYFIVFRAGNRSFTAIKQNILIPAKKLLQRIEIPAWETVGAFQRFQKDGFQQVYPYVGVGLIHSEYGCMCILKTISFQIKQNKHQHALRIFKYMVFVLSKRTNTLFACKGVMCTVIFPLYLKMGIESMETLKRKSCLGLKLQFIAIKRSVSLSLHNGGKSKLFYDNNL